MQGEGRHVVVPETKYAGLEATYYDQFAGKAGSVFYRDWLLQEPAPVLVLELGVGTGRIATELAEHGMSVCGVDWSCDMLEIAERKKKRVRKENRELLELVEQDMWELDLNREFTHVLLPEGIFQQATDRMEQRKLLRIIKQHMTTAGVVAIDLLLPPLRESWRVEQKKFVFPDRMVYQRVEGETSFVRQKFRCTVTYETFLDQYEQPRYRVDREYALLLPNELELLLESEGFQLIEAFENFEKTTHYAGEKDYDRDRWQHGGYPFVRSTDASSGGTHWTAIAKKYPESCNKTSAAASNQ
ncbi:class I SAM-dependent methyltransferase [Brevibacillus nitrificans]|uniref:class I SAM-dependent methyltransferase n=1 Tax=Brevibacillus nitrificans TaxID=651560 RepID=UPI00285CE1EC|nr:class I SAM-dependent methyltransferase [Brevibacillus nitrificans]MDR7318763.1 SAM-dependent methyltransferase [Brevibacillus nitrificans]